MHEGSDKRDESNRPHKGLHGHPGTEVGQLYLEQLQARNSPNTCQQVCG